VETNVLFILIPLLCLPSVAPAAFLYVLHSSRTPKEDRFPLALYIILLMIFAFVACGVGLAWGVESACQKPGGSLCGLFGVLVGPLSSLVVVSVLAWLMTFFGSK
jgi:hypothetical protein